MGLTYVAGHKGLVGSAIVSKLCDNVITTDFDLRDKDVVNSFFKTYKPDTVILCAAKVGGIEANIKDPLPFIKDNLLIQNNVILSALEYSQKLIFMGSACIYPIDTPRPIKESDLFAGSLEPTNRSYSIAKMAGIELCRAIRQETGKNFISVMPCNIYGKNDNFSKTAHVIPALINKFSKGDFSIRGKGDSKREFLNSDDLAGAIDLLLSQDSYQDVINIGSGEEISIFSLAQLILKEMGINAEIKAGAETDGMQDRLLDSSYIRSIGWEPKIPLVDGIRRVLNDRHSMSFQG